MEDLYTIRYKLHGAPREEVFDAKNIDEARRVAKEWCDLQQYKFVYVKKFYKNLSDEIKQIKDGKIKTDMLIKPSTTKVAGALPKV
jgi:hypothetical protein